MKQLTPGITFITLLIIAMTCWGISWPLGKLVSTSAGPSVIIFWRLLLAFMGISLVIGVNRLILKQKNSFRMPIKAFLLLIISSVLMTLYNQLFFRGLATGLSGAGGVLVTTTNPLFTYILWIIIFKNKLKPGAIIGLSLGIAGGFILLEIWQINGSSLFLSGNLFFILAAIIWAILTILSQETQKQISFLTYTFYLYGFSALFSSIFAIPGDIFIVFSRGPVFWGSMVYLGIPTTALATTIYFYASNKLGSHRASSFIFIVPCVALVSSFFIHGEVPTIYTLIGGGLSIIAVTLINRYKNLKN